MIEASKLVDTGTASEKSGYFVQQTGYHFIFLFTRRVNKNRIIVDER